MEENYKLELFKIAEEIMCKLPASMCAKYFRLKAEIVGRQNIE